MFTVLLSVSSLAFIVGFSFGFMVKLSYTRKKAIKIDNTKYFIKEK